MTPPTRASTPTPSGDQLPLEVRLTLTRLRARVWGMATGLLFGFALLAATLFLVLRGGPDVGAHLGLLSIFLPGYSVTVLGGFVGFAYAFLIGYLLGWLVGRTYNVFVRPT